MALDDDLRELAAVQHGLVTRDQARARGASASAVAHRLRRGDWDEVTKRVLRLAGAPRTGHQRLMAAALDAGAGAAVSHSSAASLWRLPGFDVRAPHVSRQRGRSSRLPCGYQLHRPRWLPEEHATVRDGIPVTTVPRTLFDLAASLPEARLERLVDTVVSRAPSVLGVLHHMLHELGAHGRHGVAAMRAVLDDRPPGYVAPASGLEARFARILAEAGLPPLERQVDVGGHEWVGRVDFLDRARGIVVEVDGELHHTSRLDRGHDSRRDRALRAAGFLDVVRVSGDQVWQRPWEAVELVRRARARALLAPRTHVPA